MLKKIKWKKVYSAADEFGTGLAQFFNELITPDLFGEFGTTLAGILNTKIQLALSFGKELDFANIGRSIGTGINKFLEEFDFESLGETLNTWANGLIDELAAAVDEVNGTASVDYLTI